MQSSLARSALLGLYDGLWLAALPFLALSSRLRDGLSQRLGMGLPGGFCDLWVQAASAGEAYLARELLLGLARAGHEKGKPLSALATSLTRQGLDILEKTRAEVLAEDPEAALAVAFFPFDAPHLMARVLDAASPKAVVLLETELWPGLMARCREFGIPVLVVNGRMGSRSLAGYLLARGLWPRIRPERVLAMSDDAALRFSALFGPAGVGRMGNMKFDRLSIPDQDGPLPLAEVLGPEPSLALFGSVRQEEEPQVLAALRQVHAAGTGAVTAVVPRHLHRLDFWRKALYDAGLKPVLRSALFTPPAPDSVLLWDTFGELAAAFAHARAAYVGGALAPLGGQNFLEPLACGVVPLLGPHWDNFAWVGREILDAGLAREVRGAGELAAAMLAMLADPPDRGQVRRRFADYVQTRRGGTQEALELVQRYV